MIRTDARITGRRVVSGPRADIGARPLDEDVGDLGPAELLRRPLALAEQLDRERPTLVVVLSDHGEAFGEHQRYGHNTSPHDEMTHVPVVLHPRAMVPGALAASPDALRSLGDLYPIIARTLGLRLPAGTTWPGASSSNRGSDFVSRRGLNMAQDISTH